jgi:hypothetical protein
VKFFEGVLQYWFAGELQELFGEISFHPAPGACGDYDEVIGQLLRNFTCDGHADHRRLLRINTDLKYPDQCYSAMISVNPRAI